MNITLLKENLQKFLDEQQLDEKLILKKYSPKNLLVVVSDKEDFKERGAETYKAKDKLKSAGFSWTKLYDKDGKEVAAWAISADKESVARQIVNQLNKEEPSGEQAQFEELVFDLSTVSKKTGLDHKIVQFLERLKGEVDAAKASDEFRNYINFKKKFRNYSFSNTMLIWIQKPNATQVAGFKKWETLNRRVKKGAKGISIFVPLFKKQKQEDPYAVSNNTSTKPEPNPYSEKDLDKQVFSQRLTGFGVGFVFDISDTEVIPGKEDLVVKEPDWHAGNEPSETADKITKYVEDIIKTIELKYTQSGGAGEQGFASGGTHINLSSGVAGVNKASTLVHELAHILLHFKNSLFKSDELQNIPTNVIEYQAEATAAAVMDEYGIPYKHSPTYIAFWNQNMDDLKKYSDMVVKAASWIIDEIDKRAEADAKTQPVKEGRIKLKQIVKEILLKENPDFIALPNGELNWTDDEASAFGYDRTGKFRISSNRDEGDAVSHFELFKSSRRYDSFHGRLWEDSKILSIWGNMPNGNEFKKLISDIEKGLKITMELDKWRIELPEDGVMPWDDAALVTFAQYLKMKPPSDTFDNAPEHIKSPLKKKQREVPQGIGSTKKVGGMTATPYSQMRHPGIDEKKQ